MIRICAVKPSWVGWRHSARLTWRKRLGDPDMAFRSLETFRLLCHRAITLRSYRQRWARGAHRFSHTVKRKRTFMWESYTKVSWRLMCCFIIMQELMAHTIYALGIPRNTCTSCFPSLPSYINCTQEVHRVSITDVHLLVCALYLLPEITQTFKILVCNWSQTASSSVKETRRGQLGTSADAFLH